MPNDLVIGASPAVAASAARGAAPAIAPGVVERPASPAPRANPGVQLDVGLNIVVLQFFDTHGDVLSSIPTERQLKAYRLGQSGVGPSAEPPAGNEPAGTVPLG